VTKGVTRKAAPEAHHRQSLDFPAAFAAFHRRFAAAEILARPAADILRFPLGPRFFPFRGPELDEPDEPSKSSSFDVRDSIFCLIRMALLSWDTAMPERSLLIMNPD
jgi:hypothetical protein